jgi:hypothetical protein
MSASVPRRIGDFQFHLGAAIGFPTNCDDDPARILRVVVNPFLDRRVVLSLTSILSHVRIPFVAVRKPLLRNCSMQNISLAE